MLGCCAEHDRSGVTATYRTTTPKSGCGRVGVPWTALDGTRRSPAYAGRVPPSSIAEPGGPVPGMAMGEDARKLTVYFGERSQVAPGRFAADALLDLFGSHRIAASVLLRGIEGFGLRHTLRSDRSLSLSEDPPVVAVAVDTTGRIDDLTHDVEALNLRGLVTLERARLIRDVPETPNVPPDPPESVKVTVYVGRQDRTGRLPTYMAVCDLLHRGGLADASVFLGVDGIVVKSHGGADSDGFAAAVELAYDMVRNRLLDRIEADLDLFHARNPQAHAQATRKSDAEAGEENQEM